MGLDIYLYRYDKPLAVVEKGNEKWEAVTSGIWEEYEQEHGKSDKWPEAINKKWRADVKKAAKKEGRVGDWYNHPCEVCIEEKSKKYPDHYFKVGYFRSSYNAGGINRILEDRIGQDLYSILGIKRDEYHQQPDWKAVIKRVDSAIEQYEALLNENPYQVHKCSPNMFLEKSKVEDAEALKIAHKELTQKRDKPSFKSYTNHAGEWFTEGMTIYGVVHGISALGVPCVFLVTKDTGGEDGLRWYLHALEIVKETAEYVLAQKDQSKYYLHVSS